MSHIPSQYIVIQQNEWAGRKFFTAHDKQAGQVVYLMQEPHGGRPQSYQHASLPHLEPLSVADDTRWLTGTPPEGDTLEDLRRQGALTEQDLISMLLCVLDGLTHLAGLEPTLVPAYLDPACIKRDWMGRWKLDYLLLAHAPEARKSSGSPPGIYPFGVLLYWLFTGHSARMTRVQVDKLPPDVSPSLQFVMIRCLGRAYPSLAELRNDIEGAGHDQDFRGVAKLIHKQGEKAPKQEPAPVVRKEPEQVSPSEPEPKTRRVFPDPWTTPTATPPTVVPAVPQEPPAATRVAGVASLEYRKVPLGGPQIPIDDRPWALPARPQEGFNKFVVPPPPNVKLQKAVRWGSLGVVGALTLTLAAWLTLRSGLVPESVLPAFFRPERPVAVYPDLGRSDGQVGQVVSPEPRAPGTGGSLYPEREDWLAYKQERRRLAEQPAPEPQQPAPAPAPQPVKPSPKPAPTPRPQPEPRPVPAPTPPAQPERPVAAKPQPDFSDDDARTGGMPIRLYVNNQFMGTAYMFPHPHSPYLSLQAVNYFFDRNLYWVPTEGKAIRIYTGDGSLLTLDYSVVADRLWLKLTPFLQEGLGIEVKAFGDSTMHFVTK